MISGIRGRDCAKFLASKPNRHAILSPAIPPTRVDSRPLRGTLGVDSLHFGLMPHIRTNGRRP